MSSRWLLLMSCLILVLITQPSFAKKSDQPKISSPKNLKQPTPPFYFDDTETILVATGDRQLLQSFDGGEEWEVAGDDNGVMKNVVGIQLHPFDKKKAYALGEEGRHWITTDQAKSWTPFELPDRPALNYNPLVFHGWNSGKVIFQADECLGPACIVKSYYTTNDFKDIHPLRESTGGCVWAAGNPLFAQGLNIGKEIENRTLCIAPGLKVFLPHANRLIYSDDYFKDEQGTEMKLDQGRPVSGIVSVAAVKKFLVAAVKSKGTEELALYVTADTKTWHRAEFDGHRIEEDAYTLLESTNHSLQVDVLTSKHSEMGVLFTSNSNGTYFTRNIEHTNRNEVGTVDFEQIAGIQGIVLVNTVKNFKEVETGSEKKIVSKISFDDGRKFQFLRVGDEHLHLHSVTAYKNIGRVFSSPAPGLVMGVGNTGDHLKSYEHGDLYVSDDAGVNWRHALKGPHKYEFGDQGAVIMAISDGEKKADKISFSIDHGKEWKSVELPQKIKPEMVTTTPDSTSLKFVIVGISDDHGEADRVIYSIDFNGLHERKCEEDDFDPKWPARLDEDGKPDCLMGHKQFFRRRKSNADCFVDEKFKDPQPVFEKCKCTAKDFECEYKRSDDGENCVVPEKFLVPPKGKCKNEDDKFMGPSGWRLIPGDTCIRDGGKNLDEEVERSCKNAGGTPETGEPPVHKSSFPGATLGAYRYLERQSSSSGDDESIVMLTSKGELHVTHNHGKEWRQPLKDEKFTRIVRHPYNTDVAFLLTNGKKGYWTIDRGHTFKEFKAPHPPTQDHGLSPLVFHPQNKNLLIWTGAVDCPSIDCHSDAWISKDRGDHWDTLLRYVKKCEFETRENRTKDEELIFCEQYESENTKNPVQLRSTNSIDRLFSGDEPPIFDHVAAYASMSEYIVVAWPDPKNTDSLVASISVDGKTFAEAQFPPNVQVPVKTAYTVLESSTHAVFLYVTVSNIEGAKYGSIIKSNSNGTFYVSSLSGVSQSDTGYVDFEKMQSLEGVAVVNVVGNKDAISKGAPKKLKTMITHNDGGQWMLVPPPGKDAEGNKFGCSVVEGKGTDECSLHLHGYTERSDERDTFSSGSAIGLMMGVGNVGDHLAPMSEADTFLTADGGITWKSIKKGRYKWEYGDAGAVLVIVPEFTPSKVLYYSLDEGDTWKEYKFADVEIQVFRISTVPSDTSKNFLLWGKETSSESLVTVNVDFSGLHTDSCHLDESEDENDDYYLWEPKHPSQEENCLFGHHEQYHRKKPTAQCWNNWREPHIHSVGKDCECTLSDYECDYNYEPQSDGSCALVPGLPRPDAMAVCRENPDQIEYWEPTGYRRIPQSTCKGGYEYDHRQSRPCPSKEEEYKKKHGISGAGLFLAIVIPIAVAGAIGYYIYTRWDGKFGQIRLGDSTGSGEGLLSRDSLLITVPVAVIAGAVAVAKALPLLAVSLWRSASGYMQLGRGRGYSRPYASRGSFAARRGDYTSVVDDEDELLGVEDGGDLDEDDEP